MAITRARRTSEDEKLDDASLERVIKALEADKPVTKKDACSMLNISYNTARLDKLIVQYKEKKENEAKRRSDKRGKPATLDEISFIVSEYLEGNTIDGISKGIYRSAGFIKSILEKNHVPFRAKQYDYFRPELIPDGATRDRFAVGEKVYSARYDSLATVRAEIKHPDGFVYRLWLDGEAWLQNAYQPAWELASLQHLKEIGITI